MSDPAIRLATFEWLNAQVAIHGEVLPRRPLLEEGLDYRGQRVPLVSAQGIFKPAVMDLPLSITTTPGGPYNDSFEGEDLLLYRYRGTDPNHRDNVGLRECMRRQLPLVYFHGHMANRYHAIWPVFIVGDDPGRLTFSVRADSPALVQDVTPETDTIIGDDPDPRRKYVTSIVRHRLHQAGFRERVLSAYSDQCALCSLRHRELLDAAHIIPDSEEGEPIVSNGLSLCRIHHTAYDRNILGITPDYDVRIRRDVLEEIDGPMLRHGLQEMHGSRIWVPRRASYKPNRDHLALRYEQFRKAG